MKIKNNILYDVRNEDLNADGSFVVPNGVTSIRDFAFHSCCIRLTSIIISNSVTSIGDNAFYSCSNLTSAIIGNSVTNIGHYAFSNCIRLTSVIIPDSVTNIECFAFAGCIRLTSVTIGNGVTNIGRCAFRNCIRLTSIIIPDSVTSISMRAFLLTDLESKPDNYKAFILTETGKLMCRYKTYTVGEKSMVEDELRLCRNGIHYCTNIFNIFNYYSGEYGKDFVIGVCEVSDENIGGSDDSKRCARWVKPTKILTREEVIKILNGEGKEE